MSEETYDPGVAALESTLAALVPLAGRIDRDQLMFRAGQASVPHRGWAWPGATAVVALVAVGLTVVLVRRPPPPVVERTIYVRVEPPVAPPDPVVPDHQAASDPTDRLASEDVAPWPAQAHYFQLQQQILERGLDALPDPPAGTTQAPAEPLDGALDMPPGTPAKLGLVRLKTLLQSGDPS